MVMGLEKTMLALTTPSAEAAGRIKTDQTRGGQSVGENIFNSLTVEGLTSKKDKNWDLQVRNSLLEIPDLRASTELSAEYRQDRQRFVESEQVLKAAQEQVETAAKELETNQRKLQELKARLDDPKIQETIRATEQGQKEFLDELANLKRKFPAKTENLQDYFNQAIIAGQTEAIGLKTQYLENQEQLNAQQQFNRWIQEEGSLTDSLSKLETLLRSAQNGLQEAKTRSILAKNGLAVAIETIYHEAGLISEMERSRPLGRPRTLADRESLGTAQTLEMERPTTPAFTRLANKVVTPFAKAG